MEKVAYDVIHSIASCHTCGKWDATFPITECLIGRLSAICWESSMKRLVEGSLVLRTETSNEVSIRKKLLSEYFAYRSISREK